MVERRPESPFVGKDLIAALLSPPASHPQLQTSSLMSSRMASLSPDCWSTASCLILLACLLSLKIKMNRKWLLKVFLKKAFQMHAGSRAFAYKAFWSTDHWTGDNLHVLFVFNCAGPGFCLWSLYCGGFNATHIQSFFLKSYSHAILFNTIWTFKKLA